MPKPKSTPASATSTPATRKKTAALLHNAKAVSAADRARAEALLAEIGRRKLRIVEDFYDIGQALRELQKKKLYVALGHASFAAMLTARDVMSTSQAHRLIRIVSALPRDKALAVGSAKAALLVGYADATPEPDTPAWLLDKGKLPSGKRLADASAREIADAAKKARSPKARKAASPEEAAARAAARKAQAALRKRGAKGATAEAVKSAGQWWLHIRLLVAAAELLNA